MNNPGSKNFLRNERQQTDKSLVTERGKTDESLFALRKKAELETDARVKTDRDEADQARAQSRTDTDSGNAVSDPVTEQRDFDDTSVKDERTRMDAAIRKERRQKEEVLTNFLQSERLDTDGKLFRERARTDSWAATSRQDLSDETSLHNVTKAALTSREEFLAIVSHDLRNPIGAVVSCAEMLIDEEKNKNAKNETVYWLEFIKRNAQTSLRLISDILDMERFANGKIHLAPKKQNIIVLVQETVEEFSYAASDKDISIEFKPALAECEVTCDRDRIRQVLSNLVGNALKFTSEGGKIRLTLTCNQKWAEVSVIDNGLGIKEDQREKIFERFAQINNHDRQGLGLGLFISKSLIEAHNGTLTLTSEFGKGSCFKLQLPMQTSAH